MNRLQVLITDKLREGKSFRQIAEESGVNHVSISQYHKGIEPDGKNLAKLAKYFRVDFWELVENQKVSTADAHKIDIESLSPAQRELWDCIQSAPDETIKKALQVVELFLKGL